MPDQLDFNETYENRTEETKRAIASLLEDLGIAESEKLTIYAQNNWDTLSNPILYTFPPCLLSQVTKATSFPLGCQVGMASITES